MTPPPGWMEGFADDPPAPRHRPAPKPAPPFPDQAATAAVWAPGQDTVQRSVVCCPACGSDEVAARDNGKSEQLMRWECGRCTNAWKRQRIATHKCYGID